MLENQQIICFGEEWGISNLLSKQRYMGMLAEKNRIIYANNVPVRSPRLNASDLAKIFRRLRGSGAAIKSSANPNLTIRSPLVIPYHSNPLARAINAAWLRAQAKSWLRTAGFHEPILWVGVPTASPLIGALQEKCLIYHLTDDYIHQDNAPTDALRPMDEALARAADVVFVTSETLLERKRAFNSETYLVEHGVDYALFNQNSLEKPPEFEGIPRPVFGYHGFIDERVDRELLFEVIRRKPEWSFVIVGDANVDISALESLPNLYRVPFQPYERIPVYVRQFDVSFVPYRVYERTRDGNPLKVKEYLAAGLPVLVPDIPCMKNYGSLVWIVKSPGEFIQAGEEALKSNDAENQARRRTYAQQFSWVANLEFMSGRVQAAMERRKSFSR